MEQAKYVSVPINKKLFREVPAESKDDSSEDDIIQSFVVAAVSCKIIGFTFYGKTTVVAKREGNEVKDKSEEFAASEGGGGIGAN